MFVYIDWSIIDEFSQSIVEKEYNTTIFTAAIFLLVNGGFFLGIGQFIENFKLRKCRH